MTRLIGIRLARSLKLWGAIAAGALFTTALLSDGSHIRYLHFDEVSGIIRLFRGSGLSGTQIRDTAAWDAWVHTQDKDVRMRIARGVEDSISNMILYGTSYTKLPRLESAEDAVTDSGELTAKARERVQALAEAVGDPRTERLRFIRNFLVQRGVPQAGEETFLADNLKRLANEQRSYRSKLQNAAKSSDAGAVFATRGTLYSARGLSVDTSLLPNYAIQDTLRVLLAKHAVARGGIHRIAIIGPGLDFTDKRDGYDFYPLQTTQPFAIMEAVLGLGLSKPDEVRVVTLDLNSLVNSHIADLAKEGRSGSTYTVQLPRDTQAGWNAEAIDYWEHFGDILGSTVKPLPIPGPVEGVESRAVAIRPSFSARVQPLDVDIVSQTVDGEKFDLVVATNILVYYNRFQQALAMGSIAHMMNSGGLFLANSALPAQHTESLEYLGRRTVSYSATGAYGDDVVVYRRR